MMTPEKLVTICVPTFNNETTLQETLDSIIQQSHQNLKIKIFDNASTDGTLAIATKFAENDTRIQIVSNSTNIGAEGNFNLCLAAAEGDFTAIFHADDLYEKSMVARQVEFLSQNSNCVAVATQASIIDGAGQLHGLRFLPHKISGNVTFDFDQLFELTLEFGNFVTCPSVMARSSVYRDIIKIWDGKNYGSSADLDVWLRLAKAGRFGILTEPLMRYRVSEASFTVRETKRRFTEHDLLKVYRSYLRELESSSAQEKLRYLQFHEFKDTAARRLNILQSGRRDISFPPIQVSSVSLFPLAFKSRYHFKFLAASYAINTMTGFMKFARIHK